MNQHKKILQFIIIVLAFWAVSCSSSKPLPTTSDQTSPSRPVIKVPESIDPRFLGTWLVEGSSAEFDIVRAKKQIKIKGFDYTDNEAFKIRNTSWKRSLIKTTIIMPSTGHALNLNLTIINEDQLLCTFSGKTTGKTNWIRKQ